MYAIDQITAGTTIVTDSETSGVVTQLLPEGKNGKDIVLFLDSDGGNSWCYVEEIAGIFS